MPVPVVRHRQAAALGLEPVETAAGGGDADRAEAVGAERRGGQPGGDRHGGTAAGAAGRARRGPRGCAWRRTRATRSPPIVSSSGTCVLPSSTVPAARSRRTTSSSSAAGAAVGERAARGDLARHVRVVLDRDRHAVQRRRVVVAAAAVGRVGGGERLVGEHDAEAAHQRLEALDPLQVELGQLARRDLAGPDQLGLAREAGEGEVGGIHGADPIAATWRSGRARRCRRPREPVACAGDADRADARRAALAGLAPRRVCSDVERRAAVWAHDDLRARGHEAWMETHWVRPQLELAAGARVRRWRRSAGWSRSARRCAGLALAAAGALSLLVDVAGRTGPLRLLLPRRATQVVLVAPGAARGGGRRRRPARRRPHRRPRRGVARRLAHVPGGLSWLAACALPVAAARRRARRRRGGDAARRGAARARPSSCSSPPRARSTPPSRRSGTGAPRTRRSRPRWRCTTTSCAIARTTSRRGCCSQGRTQLRAHLRRERLDPARTALLARARRRRPQPASAVARRRGGGRRCRQAAAVRAGCPPRSRRPSTRGGWRGRSTVARGPPVR